MSWITYLTTEGWRESVVVSSLKWLESREVEYTSDDFDTSSYVAKNTKDYESDEHMHRTMMLE